MAEPYASKYDTSPLAHNESQGDSTPDPDAGKDFGYLVPQVSVAWETPPSFNKPPKDAGGGSGGQSSDVTDSGPILMDGPSVRAAESAALGGLRTASSGYSNLRGKVSSLNADFFGPKEKKQPVASVNTGTANPTGTSSGTMSDGDTDPEGNEALHQMADQFYESIKPAMQKALWQIANSLEVSGQYLAMVNKAGQTYAQMDRACVFPDPPSSSVVQ
ncbi:hypothetical protein ABZT06_46745 [Streptomyces sp. NPDC005483]|uniref:hypothetical protein n=1 Tax=Streptomyces sp. NPDC005483 TaxID=3154882 RepID=UPI0033A431E7